MFDLRHKHLYAHRMKNYVVLLLIMLLPLQTAWGVAALFCQHESSSTQWHWGHHEHQLDAACQAIVSQSVTQLDQKVTQQHGQPLTQSIESPQHPAADAMSPQYDADSKKTNQSHPFQLANHSDHLQANPLGLNPALLEILVHPSNDFLGTQLTTSLALFYQTPYLEQPKPPLWPA